MDQHLGFDFRHALQAELVNLVGGEIGGGLVADGEAIARFSVGQSPDAGIEASVRSVIVAHELGEFRVGGRDFIFYRGFDLLAQLLAVGFGDGIGKLAQRLSERTLVERVVGNLLRLAGNFFEQILRRHAVVAQSVAHVSHGLVEHARNLVQAGRDSLRNLSCCGTANRRRSEAYPR